MLQRIAQLGAGSAEPQRPDGARGRRRAGTSSTTSSAQQSLVGPSTSRPSAAHFLRPNKAWEGVFKPPAAGPGWGFPADLTSTRVRRHPPRAQAAPPDGLAGAGHAACSFHTKVRRRR